MLSTSLPKLACVLLQSLEMDLYDVRKREKVIVFTDFANCLESREATVITCWWRKFRTCRKKKLSQTLNQSNDRTTHLCQRNKNAAIKERWVISIMITNDRIRSITKLAVSKKMLQAFPRRQNLRVYYDSDSVDSVSLCSTKAINFIS